MLSRLLTLEPGTEKKKIPNVYRGGGGGRRGSRKVQGNVFPPGSEKDKPDGRQDTTK